MDKPENLHIQFMNAHSFMHTIMDHKKYVYAHQAKSTWTPSFPAFAEWPIMALTHSTKEAFCCQDLYQSKTLPLTFHPTYSFQSSDECHSAGLKKKNTMKYTKKITMQYDHVQKHQLNELEFVCLHPANISVNRSFPFNYPQKYPHQHIMWGWLQGFHRWGILETTGCIT